MALVWKAKPESEELGERQLAEYLKALGHPVRVRILRTLLTREETDCGDLVALFPLAQSTVSQHLRILKGVGLIDSEAKGPRRRYTVNVSAVRRFKRYVDAL